MGLPAQQFTTEFLGETCYSCGVVWYMPAGLQQRRREDHESFYCPNGHGQHYTGKTDAEKAREELAREKEHRERVERRLEFEKNAHAATERQRRAAKGQLTKVKRRIANGVCPCCQRSFSNLAGHMKTQHPGYVEAQP